jgi:hypothetical protein
MKTADKDSKIIFLAYLTIILTGFVSHMDQGMIANSTTDIEKYFGDLTNTEVAIMSVGNVVGNVFGTILSAPLYTKLEPKLVLVVSLFI